jgi:integron integrase
MTTPRLFDQVRAAIRVRHYSRRTEDTYVHWIRRFILFHAKRHPREMGEREVTAFLTYLAVDKNVAASTQNQALAAILFLYQKVLEMKLDWLEDVVRARRPKRLPVVLSRDEVARLLNTLQGLPQLIARLMYGTGMRLLEALRLRVKDVDFARRQVSVRAGKGDKDRYTMLPEALIEPLQAHLLKVAALHNADLANGFGSVQLPFALARKYPKADREMGLAVCIPLREILNRQGRYGVAPTSPR